MSKKSTPNTDSYSAIWVHDPTSNKTIDVQPLFEHLNFFADTPKDYAEDIDEVMYYMMQGLNPSLDECSTQKMIELHFMLRKMRDTFRAMSVKA